MMPLNPTDDSSPTAKAGAAGELTTNLPTVSGRIPPELQGRFRPAEPGEPEFCRLPSPRGGRCSISGASRSWLVEHNAQGGNFLFTVRQKGKQRGTVFVDVSKLKSFLRSWQAANEAERRTDGKEGEP